MSLFFFYFCFQLSLLFTFPLFISISWGRIYWDAGDRVCLIRWSWPRGQDTRFLLSRIGLKGLERSMIKNQIKIKGGAVLMLINMYDGKARIS
jgi:hypothetical protein